MILSKQSIQIIGIASKDKQIQGLDNLHVTANGSTVAVNRNTVAVCSPLSEEIKETLPLQDSGEQPGITFSTETAKHLISAIPADTMFKGRLEFMDLKEISDFEIQFTMHDGKRKKTIEARKYNGKYIPYEQLLNRVLSKRGNAVKCILNRARLKLLLDILDKTCEDISSGESPAFIEFCQDGDIIIRGENQKNGQRTLAIMTAYKTQDWLEPDNWEKDFYKPLKKAVRRRNAE